MNADLLTNEYRLPALAPARTALERMPDGTLEMFHPEPLEPHAPHLGHYLAAHARQTPDSVFLGAPRADGTIETLTYAAAAEKVDRLSQGLLDLGLGPERPLAVVAENSIAFGLLKLAAMQVGIPVAPISTAYGRHDSGLDKLAYILDLLRPGAVAFDASVRAADLTAAGESGLIRLPDAGSAEARPGECSFDSLARGVPTDAVKKRFDQTRPEGIAKILFTSGSTGMPKGVITTHRMLVSNIVALGQLCPFLRQPPLLVDWLPWNHCFGGNFNFNLALMNGGSLYIDAGRPVEGRFDETSRLLERFLPTIYLNVPVGFERLCAVLEADAAFARRFFSRLDAMFYAGSTMPAPLWDRLTEASRRALGRAVMIFTGYGTTESTPLHTLAHWPSAGPSHVGVPIPGSRVRLLACADQYEIRSKGPNVTPGYFRQPEKTGELFDADGWMIMGDAVTFADADVPARGLFFHGRIAGNFKLQTGTWVQAEEIRVAAIAHGAGLVRDAIVVGHDRREIGLLLFLDPPALARIAGGDARDATREEAARAAIAAGLRAYNREHSSSSRRIGRFLILEEPPKRYERELTDKGYLNQTEARARRAAMVAALYAEPPGPEVERLP